MAKRKWIVKAQLGPDRVETWEIDLVDDCGYSEKATSRISDSSAQHAAMRCGREKASELIDVRARPADELGESGLEDRESTLDQF